MDKLIKNNEKIIKNNLKNLKKSNKVDYFGILSHSLKFDDEGKCINAFQALSEIWALKLSYESLKSNPGNMVKGTDKKTFDGLNESWFENTHKELISEAYQPKPSRRVHIPKPNGKKRPLGVASPRDKIIQQSMKLILEYILEPKFHEVSHGFRPGKGCHTALKEIRSWRGVPWLIEGDIKNFFPTINHYLLETLLKRHFNEVRFFNLYWKMVNAGYMEWDTKKLKFIASDVGVPQGSIISPTLSNLVLHELDEYVIKIINEHDEASKGKQIIKTNPAYHRLVNRNYRLKTKIQALIDQGKDFEELRNEYVKNIRIRNRIKATIYNPEYTKIRYVRYADDWLMGVWAPYKVAYNIRKNIGERLKQMFLELSFDKTKITNTRKNRAKFLSTYIKRVGKPEVVVKRTNEIGRKVRIPTGNLWMTAPIPEIIDKLENKGFLTKKGNWIRINRIPQFTSLPLRDIVLRYRSIYRGLINFYKFTDNKKRFMKIQWILKESLFKTFMNKLDCSKTEIRKKYGNNITVAYGNGKNTNKKINFEWPKLERTPMFFSDQGLSDPFEPLKFNISSRNLFKANCTICNSDVNIEMHHIKHIKTINANLSKFDKMVASINRKQVPLCRNCHIKIHTGKYLGTSLKKLTNK